MHSKYQQAQTVPQSEKSQNSSRVLFLTKKRGRSSLNQFNELRPLFTLRPDEERQDRYLLVQLPPKGPPVNHQRRDSKL